MESGDKKRAKNAKASEINEEDISLLKQLVMSLDQAEKKLEEAHRKKKPEQFKAIKEFILKLQKKISEVVWE